MTRSERIKKEKERKISRLYRFLAKSAAVLCLSLIVLCAAAYILIFHSPYTRLKELYVTTAMSTMNHQYLARLFVSDEEIARIMDKNSIEASTENTNTGEINTGNIDNSSDAQGTGNDREIEPGIELIDIKGQFYKGYLLIVKDPSRIAVGTSQMLGSRGMKVADIAKDYGAAAAINAGGFSDEEGHGSGGEPEGLLIENYKVLHTGSSKKYNLIGFDSRNVLVLGNYTLEEIQNINIRDAISFRPFLIINGNPVIKNGDGGWGISPRTAIGQRKDGTVLLLVIDGRQVSSVGATLKDVQDIMQHYGAHNAANLDGGSSSTLVHEQNIVNSPSSKYGPRYVPSAFIVK